MCCLFSRQAGGVSALGAERAPPPPRLRPRVPWQLLFSSWCCPRPRRAHGLLAACLAPFPVAGPLAPERGAAPWGCARLWVAVDVGWQQVAPLAVRVRMLCSGRVSTAPFSSQQHLV